MAMANESTPAKAEPVKIDKTLRAETEAQRSGQAKVSEADIAECRARMAALKTPGRILDHDGKEVVVPVSLVRAMFEASPL
jgi:hypothetical protein